MKVLVYLFIFLSSTSAFSAQDSDQRFANDMITAAKVAGMCGTFKQMYAFQESTKMDGGDAFIDRFLSTEIARLGMTAPEFFKMCNDAIGAYNKLNEITK